MTDTNPAGETSPSESSATDTDTDAGGPVEDAAIKDSFRAALARKSGQNSHVEQHLGGRRLGAGNNDTHKRRFRRKSG